MTENRLYDVQLMCSQEKSNVFLIAFISLG